MFNPRFPAKEAKGGRGSVFTFSRPRGDVRSPKPRPCFRTKPRWPLPRLLRVGHKDIREGNEFN